MFKIVDITKKNVFALKVTGKVKAEVRTFDEKEIMAATNWIQA